MNNNFELLSGILTILYGFELYRDILVNGTTKIIDSSPIYSNLNPNQVKFKKLKKDFAVDANLSYRIFHSVHFVT
jgi:hypothetical protein